MTTTLKNIIFLVLSVFWNKLYVNASDASEYRTVKNYQFPKGQYYDTVKYEWDITPTHNVGVFDYFVSANHAVCALVMNSTDYENWTNIYYPQWVKNPDYTFDFLNDDYKVFMCRSPVAACQRYNVKFTDSKLYLVILRQPNDDDETTYILKDVVDKYQNKSSAKLIYDPKNPPKITTTTSTSLKTTSSDDSSANLSTTANSEITNSTESQTNSSSTNGQNGLNNPNGNSAINGTSSINNSTGVNNNPGIDGMNDGNKNKDADKNHGWYWYIIGGGLLLLLSLAAVILSIMDIKKDKKRNKEGEIINQTNNAIAVDQNQFTGTDNNNRGMGAKPIAYNPHHAVKRVAYNYKADDVTIERDNILEITKRYNDGWAMAINPKNGKECLVPLIILEGDLSEDLANIPLEEKSSKNILATPESLYDNEYISQKDYESMKRNDDWMKKVKIMKYGTPETAQNIVVDNEQFKYVSHSIQESNLDNELNRSRSSSSKKSMVATVVNSNTELLNADHILEVCEDDDYDYEPEQGVIIKEDL